MKDTKHVIMDLFLKSDSFSRAMGWSCKEGFYVLALCVPDPEDFLLRKAVGREDSNRILQTHGSLGNTRVCVLVFNQKIQK